MFLGDPGLNQQLCGMRGLEDRELGPPRILHRSVGCVTIGVGKRTEPQVTHVDLDLAQRWIHSPASVDFMASRGRIPCSAFFR